MGLPPVTSEAALAVLTGYNRGFIWSLVHQSDKHYRVFRVAKGRGWRQIESPRVGLKFIQKWLSIHVSERHFPLDAVHGFVPGRSHITAAQKHLNAEWVVSMDIEDFFPSTNLSAIRSGLQKIGYVSEAALSTIERICSFHGRLSQGAPTSPLIANLCMSATDARLAAIASEKSATFTRYADDIVFSGKGDPPDGLVEAISAAFEGTPWRINRAKTKVSVAPARLKVHGLLVHGERLRLTKGYRNRVRAISHLVAHGRVPAERLAEAVGHLGYSAQIDRVNAKEVGQGPKAL
ncbi:reverse transcriptase family protein [Neotabrizicola shimadae]|uniref:RNA-directed DNA polymerase n=1 Tax=Neotabrizicola shimadae TaxID=2807096 RepID=A0A8G0ZMV9_9RHOB|nr:reverse transcriptase family protein [Neotabrizicola shimadae]QYZ68266.1 RNA-directed DNA polymerase [Neotabrizicola shimadae]